MTPYIKNPSRPCRAKDPANCRYHGTGQYAAPFPTDHQKPAFPPFPETPAVEPEWVVRERKREEENAEWEKITGLRWNATPEDIAEAHQEIAAAKADPVGAFNRRMEELAEQDELPASQTKGVTYKWELRGEKWHLTRIWEVDVLYDRQGDETMGIAGDYMDEAWEELYQADASDDEVEAHPKVVAQVAESNDASFDSFVQTISDQYGEDEDRHLRGVLYLGIPIGQLYTEEDRLVDADVYSTTQLLAYYRDWVSSREED